MLYNYTIIKVKSLDAKFEYSYIKYFNINIDLL